MDRSRELFSAFAGGAGPKGARAALARFALLVLGAAWYPTVAASRYTGTPISIPGTFQAENLDRGGEGLGYHDLTAGNTGGQYHTPVRNPYPACLGTHLSSPVTHDRVLRGASPLAAFAGAAGRRAELVNGVLTAGAVIL